MTKIENQQLELIYEVSKIIYLEKIGYEDLYSRLRKIFKINLINLKDFMNIQFKKDSNGYYLLSDYDKAILNIIQNNSIDYDNIGLKRIDDYIKDNNFMKNFNNESSYFNFLRKSGIYLESIDELKNYPITNNYKLIDLFEEFNEDLTIEQLLKLPNIEIYYKTRLFLDYLIFIVKNMDFDFDNYFEDKYNNLISNLNNIQLEILKQRIISNDPVTLEELGNKFSLTRERIRQIESRILRNLRLSQTNKFVLDFFILNYKNKKFAYSYEIDSITENLSKNSKNYFMILVNESMDTDYYFDKNLNLIVEKSKFSYDLLKNEIVKIFGDMIHKNANLPIQAEKSLKHFYNEFNNIYLLKGTPKRNMVLKILDENFTKGYKISSEDDYYKLIKIYKQTYGDNLEIPELRSVQIALSNSDFITVDKGLYKNVDSLELINDNLLNEISEFISKQKDNTYYKTIFHKFKEKLEEQGISNWNHLKGLLDYQLGFVYNSKRDYIELLENSISPNSKIRAEIQEFKDKFNLDDLRKKYPGVADYVFMNLITANKEIIKLNDFNFILYKNLNLNDKTKNDLNKFIDETFDVLNVDILTSRKIFSRLNLKRPDLARMLNKIDDHSSLFSLINYYFTGVYQLRRPLISKNSFENLNIINVVQTQFDDKDKITIDDFVGYSNRIGLRENFGFNELASLLSEKFIQINETLLINMNNLNIKREDIILIKSILLKELRNGNKIIKTNSRIFDLLPKMSFNWSLHSLRSFARAYLTDSFLIEHKAGSTGLYEIIIKEII